jgi:hypothetical protein
MGQWDGMHTDALHARCVTGTSAMVCRSRRGRRYEPASPAATMKQTTRRRRTIRGRIAGESPMFANDAQQPNVSRSNGRGQRRSSLEHS